jgi:hypothetical protein
MTGGKLVIDVIGGAVVALRLWDVHKCLLHRSWDRAVWQVRDCTLV